MSSSCRMVAVPKAEPASSGTYSATSIFGIERAIGDEHRAERACEGLGDGHRPVLAIFFQYAEVALIERLAPDAG